MKDEGSGGSRVFSRRSLASVTLGVGAVIVGCRATQPAITSATPPPPPVAPRPPSIIGVNAVTLSDPSTRSHQYDLIKTDGFGAVRVYIQWALIEPQPGEFDWADTDSLVDGAASRGLMILGLVTYGPYWSVPPENRLLIHAAPADAKAWGTFMAVVAKRYSNVIHNWEIWNEPNIDDSFAPGPDLVLYAAMLREAYDAIKSLDPGAVVITGGTSPRSTIPPRCRRSPSSRVFMIMARVTFLMRWPCIPTARPTC